MTFASLREYIDVLLDYLQLIFCILTSEIKGEKKRDDMWFDLYLHNIKISKGGEDIDECNHCIRHISFQSIELSLLNRSLTSIILIAKINNLDRINERMKEQ